VAGQPVIDTYAVVLWVAVGLSIVGEPTVWLVTESGASVMAAWGSPPIGAGRRVRTVQWRLFICLRLKGGCVCDGHVSVIE
jgi:hypothetical protein